MEIAILPCPECGVKTLISNPTPGKTLRCSCGAQLELRYVGLNPKPRTSSSSRSIGDILMGIAIGTIFVGPFLWTPLGRAFTTEAVRRGAGVTREKVEEWIKKGEKRT